MPKPSVNVNRIDLENAIKMVEADKPFDNRSQLHKAVSSAMQDSRITPAIVSARIREWNLECKTPFGRITKERAASMGIDKDDEVVAPVAAAPRRSGLLAISTPAGDLPTKCKLDYSVIMNPTESGLLEWTNRVQAHAYESNRKLLPNAFVYHLRKFVDINTPEYEVVKEALLVALAG